MDVVGLPARIGYAAAALALGSVAGFYGSVFLLPGLATYLALPDSDGFGMYQAALCVGGALALSASLIALTLPWWRHRKRRGRTGRVALSCGIVLIASLGFAGQVHELIYDLCFAAWLAYLMAFTFVRYGVLDQERRTRSSVETSSSTDSAT